MALPNLGSEPFEVHTKVEGDDELLRSMRNSDQWTKTAFRLHLSDFRWSGKLREIYAMAYRHNCDCHSHVEKHWLRKEMFIWINGYTRNLISVYKEIREKWEDAIEYS